MRIAHRSTLALAATVVAAAAVLTACGGSSSTSSSSSAAAATPSEMASETPSDAASEMASDTASPVALDVPDVCAAAPADTIATIIGTDPGAPTAGTGSCVYEDVKLQIGVVAGDSYDASLESMKSDPETASVEDISGIGDHAVYGTQTDGTGAVFAVQGDWAVVAVGPFDEDQLSSVVTTVLGAIG